MTDATQTPTLDYAFPSHLEGRCNFLPLSAELQTRCRDELTALKAENTELRAAVLDAVETMKAMDDEIGALKSARPKPVRAACGCLGAAHPRKLREVKGVTYADERFHFRECRYVRVVDLITHYPIIFTDADHAAIYALKDDPFEPVETVEEVLHYALNRAYMAGLSVTTMRDWEGIDELTNSTAARLRAARDAETGGDADA